MSEKIVDVEDEELPNDQDAPQFNDESMVASANRVVHKKSRWTKDEDAMLENYVQKKGKGKWDDVQKLTGLSRCGKSCRLRWKNHLSPTCRKGALSVEEKRLIAELYSKMGSKWSQIAAHLSGRNDNEIKNYWNTHIKKHKRDDLPLYPSGLCVQESKESELGRSTTNLILKNDFGSSQQLDFLPSSSPYHAGFRDSTMPSSLSSKLSSNGFYTLPHFKNFKYEEFAQSLFGNHSFSSTPHFNSMCTSHSLPNGKSFASQPTIEIVKLKLPSFRPSEIDLGICDTSPPPPMHESVPLMTSLQKADHSDNSGLQDDLVIHACYLGSSNPSIVAPGEDHVDCKSTFGTTSTKRLVVNTNRNSFNEQELAQTIKEILMKGKYVCEPWSPNNSDEEWIEEITKRNPELSSDLKDLDCLDWNSMFDDLP